MIALKEAKELAKAEARAARHLARQMERASDDSEEESEEDEESEEEGDQPLDEDSAVDSSVNIVPQKHPLEVRCDEIKCRCANLVNLTLLRPITVDADVFTREASKILDLVADHESRAKSAVKLPEDVSVRQSSLSRGGLDFWNPILTEPEHPAGKGKDKKPPVVATGKKKAESASQEQTNAVYKFIYERVMADIYFAAEASFTKNDCDLEQLARDQLRNAGYHELPQLAMLRKEDFNDGGYQGAVVFIDFDDNIFRDETNPSAFKSTSSDKARFLQVVQEVVELGARAIVLIYENTFLKNGNFESIDSAIQRFLSEYLNMDFARIDTLAQLSFHLDDLEKVVDYSSTPCPVFLMANIANPHVAPTAQSIIDEGSVESEIIPCGYDEFMERTKIKLANEYVEVVENNRSVRISPNPATALSDIFQRERARFGAVWIYSCHKSIYPPAASVLSQLGIDSDTYISSQLKESLLWATVIFEMHYLEDYRKMANTTSTEDQATEDSLLCNYALRLFPADSKALKFVSLIGGELRPDKFQLIDHLIDMADVLALTGEVAIPFIAAVRGVSFLRVKNCETHRALARHLLKKARLRGVKVVIPIDLVVGDTEISGVDRLQSEQGVDPSSRDDGAEYEGDSSILKLDVFQETVSDVFVYDIGPSSIRAIEEEVRSASMVLVWGTAGVCESSSFQSGQRAVVECVAAKEGSVTTPLHPKTLVIGESTVEWFSRIYDADGEITGGDGDLAKIGVVSYMQRSNALARVLCLHKSNVLSRTRRRSSVPEDWILYEPKRATTDDNDDE